MVDASVSPMADLDFSNAYPTATKPPILRLATVVPAILAMMLIASTDIHRYPGGWLTTIGSSGRHTLHDPNSHSHNETGRCYTARQPHR